MRLKRRMFVGGIAAIAIGAGVAIQATPALAELSPVDVSVSVDELSPVQGGHVFWYVTAKNNGSEATIGSEVVSFIYNEGGNPAVPGQDRAFTNVHVISSNAADCVVAAATFAVRCTFTPLDAGAAMKFTIMADAPIKAKHDIVINWQANASAPPGDDFLANNTENGGTTIFTPEAPSPALIAGGNNLLVAGTTLASDNRQYTLTVQTNGNLIESGNGRTLWQTHTTHTPGGYLELGVNDGSLRIVDGNEQPAWSATLSRQAVNYPALKITDEGNVTEFDPDGSLWHNSVPGSNGLTSPAHLTDRQYIHAGAAKLVLNGTVR